MEQTANLSHKMIRPLILRGGVAGERGHCGRFI